MAQACNNSPSRLLGSVVGGVIAATATQYFSASISSHIETEMVCWTLLKLLVRCVRSSEEKAQGWTFALRASSRSSTVACWVLALAIPIAALCSDNQFVGTLIPALTPSLLWIQTRIEPTPARTFTCFVTTWGSVTIALIGIYTLGQWTLPNVALSLVELLALIALYAALLPMPPAKLRVLFSVDIEADIAFVLQKVCLTVLTGFILKKLLIGFEPFDIGVTLLSGAAKASTWLFAMETARQVSWTAAAVIKVYAVFASCNPFTQSSESQALLYIFCSSLVLGQLVSLIPRQVPKRGLLWALLVIPVSPYVANLFAIHTAYSRAVNFADTHEHPVEVLIRRAHVDFNALLLRQSTSYTGACDEYRRRYQMEPPPGFEEWFIYAKSHDSKIIDDFDIMYESIMPLWSLSGRQISQAMEEIQLSSKNEVWTCNYANKTGKTTCNHDQRSFDRHVSRLFNKILGDVKGLLPDVEFLVNHLDEPRVMYPKTRNASQYRSGDELRVLSQESPWTYLTQNCNKYKSNHETTSKSLRKLFGLPFVRNASYSRDLCKQDRYSHMHGLFMSPTSFRLIEDMVPVLSTGSPSTMGDILFPSPAYTETRFVYTDEHDPDWSRKKNNLYWAGSTTGAFAADSQWKNYHRQRFVSLAQNLDGKEHGYLADKSGVAHIVKSSFLNSRLFDVAFTHISQCARQLCQEQALFFRMKTWADKDEALRSRLAFDLDGNGISGRWYKLLASKSTPLKQTVLREWHDDRLLPWVHFVPVSLGMEELPELVMYLTSTRKGQQRAREIADRGREWYSHALRDEDMGVYMYRLLLELARLQDPKRPARSRDESQAHTRGTVRLRQ